MKKINPKYASRKTVDGKFEVRMIAEYDGKKTSVLTSGNSLSSAYANAEKRMAGALMNNHPNLYRNRNEASEEVSRSFTSTAEQNFDDLSLEASTASTRDATQPTPVMEGAEPDPIIGRPTQASSKNDQPKIMIKGRPANHVPYRNGNNGTGPLSLEEPVPPGILRPGEVLLTADKIDSKATNNNASIFFGRDITNDPGFAYRHRTKDRKSDSRYTAHMGSGCLDLVVGRMAPFALDQEALREGTKDQNGESMIDSKIFAAANFNTHDKAILKTVALEGGSHPGVVMDAARIYISQMTTIDYNFKIKNPRFSVNQETKNIELYPCSGIMLKADKVRMHSRQDIKIVTGGEHEKVNSQGNRITQNNGIHLMAENGRDREGKSLPQQPIVLGHNLIEALTKMIDLVSQLGAIVHNFSANQALLNQTLANHYHIDAGTLQPGIMSIESSLQGILSTIEQLANVKLAGYMTDLNRGLFCAKYLDPGGSRYINSKHNTVN